MTEVVAGLIVRDGRALLIQRHAGKAYAYRWCTPGGRVEKGETSIAALQREFEEEIAINVEVDERPIWCGEVTPEIHMTLYLITGHSGRPYPREGHGIGWFSEAEIDCLALTPGDTAAKEAIRAALRRSS